MSGEWFTIPTLAELRLPGLPTTERGIHDLANRCCWKADAERVRKLDRRGGGYEYHVTLLPRAAQLKLAVIAGENAARAESRAKRKRLHWTAFEAMTDDHRQICHGRLNVIMDAEKALAGRIATCDRASIEETLRRVLDRHGVSMSTYYEWRARLKDVDQEDWLPALAPKYTEDGVVHENRAECHPLAWAALKSDFLRPEGSGFSACYRRVAAAAKVHGWSPIPSERALRRRLDAEVEKAVQVYARKGKKKAEQLYPPQVRTKDHLHALEIVNTDGHQLDLFVWAPWNAKNPVRVILLGIQDIYSGKILSWRLASAETWDVVRACIGDMVEDYGIPEHFYMDNGRAFASAAISGGATHRNRFKKKPKKVNRFGIDEDEVAGILINFGSEPHFTRPYAGQSKPIERAWKDLAEEISKHPSMSGCYTGRNTNEKPENYRKRAVQLDVLQLHVAERIAEHNARPGRKADTAKGRSFDETFEASMNHPSTIVRRATEAQRDFWLLAEKVLHARKDRGAIHYEKNIYWSDALIEWAGRKVKIRFDPDALHEPIKVYAPDGHLICTAACTEKGKFRDVEAANLHNRNRKAWLKSKKTLLDMERKFSADELADLYSVEDKPAPKQKIRPAVTRLVTGNLALEADDDIMSDEEFEAGISATLSKISGDSSIIPFPPASVAGRKHRAEK
nr:transposase domain-containing protein [uncultured Shinella sp.]